MELITSKGELIEYLTTPVTFNKVPKTVFVSTALRKEVLTDLDQGRFLHKGKSRQFQFKSLGGGVYEASIKPLETKELK